MSTLFLSFFFLIVIHIVRDIDETICVVTLSSTTTVVKIPDILRQPKKDVKVELWIVKKWCLFMILHPQCFVNNRFFPKLKEPSVGKAFISSTTLALVEGRSISHVIRNLFRRSSHLCGFNFINGLTCIIHDSSISVTHAHTRLLATVHVMFVFLCVWVFPYADWGFLIDNRWTDLLAWLKSERRQIRVRTREREWGERGERERGRDEERREREIKGNPKDKKKAKKNERETERERNRRRQREIEKQK